MQVPLVMTVIGKDRPGLVESVARLVAQHGGNWLESRMCRLGGEFAGILRIHVAAEQEQALFQALKNLQAHGLSIVVHPDPAATASAHRRLAGLKLSARTGPASCGRFPARWPGRA